MIGGIVIAHVVGSLESLKELLKDLRLSFLSRYDIGVLGSAVDTSDVVDVDIAIVIIVKLSKCLFNPRSSIGVHGSTDHSEELVVLDKTRSIKIKGAEKASDFSLRETKHVVLHGLGELVLIEGHGVVIVHDSELLAETDDATSTTAGELGANAVDQLIRVHLGS